MKYFWLKWTSIFIMCIIMTTVSANEHHNALKGAANEHKSRKTESLLETEKKVAAKEAERFAQSTQILRAQGYEIQGFYHVSTWKDYWKQVISEQLYFLDGYRKFPANSAHNKSDFSEYQWNFQHRYASLLNISTQLYMNVATDADSDASFYQIKAVVNSLPLRYKEKIVMHMNRTVPRYAYAHANRHKRSQLEKDTQLSEGEFGTISALVNYCQRKHANNEKAMVYYLHSKGSCCWKNTTTPNPVAAWRDYMNAMNIEFPSICMRALLKKYSACGTQNQDAHYSGNFWWADCEHIARLPVPTDRYDFMGAENFVLNAHTNSTIARYFGFQCGYSIFYYNENLYLTECPRESYFHRISRNVFHHQILPNFVNPDSDNSHVCYHWRTEGRSYQQQAKDIEDFYRIHARES